MKKKEYKTPIAKCTQTKYESVMAGFSTAIVEDPYGKDDIEDGEIGTAQGGDGESVAKKHTLIDVWDDGDDGDDGL